jgi:hypothetical protein
MRKELERLYYELRHRFPSTKPRIDTFPSGAARIYIDCGDDVYVVEFAPKVGRVGVSRMSTAVFGWEGFENTFETAGKAREFVLRLIADRRVGDEHSATHPDSALELPSNAGTPNSLAFSRDLLDLIPVNSILSNQSLGLISGWGHVSSEGTQPQVSVSLEVASFDNPAEGPRSTWIELTLTPEVARRLSALLLENADDATSIAK